MRALRRFVFILTFISLALLDLSSASAIPAPTTPIRAVKVLLSDLSVAVTPFVGKGCAFTPPALSSVTLLPGQSRTFAIYDKSVCGNTKFVETFTVRASTTRKVTGQPAYVTVSNSRQLYLASDSSWSMVNTSNVPAVKFQLAPTWTGARWSQQSFALATDPASGKVVYSVTLIDQL